MAYDYRNPGKLAVQPDPVLTNAVSSIASTGGWLADILAPVKAVPKDYVRWRREDAQSLLNDLLETVRKPGGRALLISRPTATWLTSSIVEDAVRAEYTEEDVRNSISSEEPRMNSAAKVSNVLRFAIENKVASLYNPAGFAAANMDAASGLWAGSTCEAIFDVENAKAAVAENAGIEPNFIRFPRKKWAAFVNSDLVAKNPAGIFGGFMAGVLNGGFPPTLFGLRLLIGTPRHDTAPTGTLTPAFLWDSTTYNLDDTVHVGYSPSLNAEQWNGIDPTFAAQFENQIDGTAFEAGEYPSPNYPEDKTTIVYGSVRRAPAEVVTAGLCFAITGV